MTDFLLVIVIAILIYMLINSKTGETPKEEISYKDVLPSYLQKNCEITIKKPLFMIDVMYSIKGVLTDLDEEWFVIERMEKKKMKVKILRTELISGIKEIKE